MATPRSIRIVSLNANKRMNNRRRLGQLSDYLNTIHPNLVLLQEPWQRRALGPTELGSLASVAESNSNVAAFASEGLAFSMVRVEERWLTLDVGGVRLHNVYFPAYGKDSRKRMEFLAALTSRIGAEPNSQHVVVGDFNLGPRVEDGWFGGAPSPRTGEPERHAFRKLIERGLVDMTAPNTGPHRFTFVGQTWGKAFSFRCDLALVDCKLAGHEATRVRVDHSVREGANAFTDHSALVIDLDLVRAGHGALEVAS